MTDETPDLVKISKRKGAKGTPAKTIVDAPSTKAETLPRMNNFKHGRYAKLTTPYCNDCYLRDEDAGGNGKCPEYQPDAVCSIEKDLKKIIDQYDTRKEEDIKEILCLTAQDLFLRVQKSTIQANFDGNFVDKNFLSNQNALLNTLSMANSLNRQMQVTTMTETKTYDKGGDLREIGRMLRAEMVGDK